jgi:hypothetical protein
MQPLLLLLLHRDGNVGTVVCDSMHSGVFVLITCSDSQRVRDGILAEAHRRVQVPPNVRELVDKLLTWWWWSDDVVYHGLFLLLRWH